MPNSTVKAPLILLFKNSAEKYRNEKLPLHMNNLFNRQSLESITDKGLEMNNFSSSEKTSDYSTFCKTATNLYNKDSYILFNPKYL